MQANLVAQAGVGRWKQLLHGLMAAVLLPVPLYAGIAEFTWGTPLITGQNPFVNVVPTTAEEGSIGLLDLTFTDSITFGSTSTWSISATFKVTDTQTALTGSWEDLNRIANNGLTGSFSVGLVQGLNDMFDSTYTSPDQIPTGIESLTETAPLLPSETPYTVTLTFTFTNGTFMSSSSTDTGVFRLKLNEFNEN